jgi:hypothetical protein
MIAAMRVAILVVLAGCGSNGKPAAPTPIDNQTEQPAAKDWRPSPEQRAQLRAKLDEARAAHQAEDDEGCQGSLGEIEAAWLGSELDAQVLALAMTCTGWTEEFCDYYIDDNTYCTLKLETELAPRRAYADAVAAPCGFGGHDISVAIPGEPDRCVAIERGAGAELEDLDEDGEAPAGSCPRLVVLERDGTGARVVELVRTTPSVLDSISDCCNATELAASRAGDALRIVLSSGGPARDCFGGTASVDQFEVYRVDGDQLVLEAQLNVGMH